MDNVVEVWLYGPLARYAGEASQGSYAQLKMEIPEQSTLGDVLRRLGIPAEERGITFVNGNLAALPGLEADLEIELRGGDRIGVSHRKSMWPFQYRFGAGMTPQLRETFRQRKDRGLRHAYTQAEE
ncbi:MAG: MoaD/ThiS family protein [Chloroflexi bacterium]|nr:MAG: MoaD/ThiS family protein [Chloroflexota bacterium]